MAPRLHTLLLTGTALLVGSLNCGAEPMGGTVVGGSATIQSPGNGNLTVNQTSQSAIINWNTFNIGAGETTRFNQPNSSSVVLNRVTGGLGPSEIYGTLTANGHVFLINRDGVLIGPGGVINTAGFLATTSDIKNSDFMAGRYNFTMPGRGDASIVNQGSITATSAGFAALVAPGVRNSGTITATLGSATLASGNIFTLDLYGDKLIQLAPGDAIAAKVIDVATGKPISALVGNDGTIKANGGRIQLTAAAARQVVDAVINNTGVLEANTVGTRAGRIVLGAATAASKPKGAPTQTVKVSGTVSASGKGKGTKGGTILVTGENIAVAAANIDASGDAGGGKVLLGGDWAGGKPTLGLVNNGSAQLESYAIPTATSLSVDAATTINASATGAGNGGKVILWSDSATTFAGTILARGGVLSGNGGFVETSSKGQLNFAGRADTSAPNGSAGTLLLDPADYYIATSDMTIPAGASSITAATLQSQLASGNVVIATNNSTSPAGQNGDIFVNAPVSWSSANSLTLNAFRNIGVNASISNSAGAAVILRADSTGTGTGTVRFGEIGSVSTSGPVSIFYNPSVVELGSKYQNPTNYSSFVTGQLTPYMLVNTFADLQAIGSNLSGIYALGTDISAGAMAPIGSIGAPFTGTLEGQSHTISNASISATGSGDNNIGMFAAIGTGGIVGNLTLSNFTATANPNITGPGQFIGTLAGSNAGTISNVTATGTVNGIPLNSDGKPINLAGVIAGGLVGQNGLLFGDNSSQTPGTIDNSRATVAVTVGNGCTGDCSSGMNAAGGLVGSNIGGSTVSNSSAGGVISGGSSSALGGLIGQNGLLLYQSEGYLVSSGTVSSSFATGAVSSSGVNVTLGGLAGWNEFGSLITNSRASGNVTATAAVNSNRGDCSGSCDSISAGGLVGQNFGTIGTNLSLDASLTTSLVLTSAAVNLTAPSLGSVCAAGFTCASGAVVVGTGGAGGGLVGKNNGVIGVAFATGNVTGADESNVGGLVSDNKTNKDSSCSINCAGGVIIDAWASGSVRAGVGSLAGGLAGTNDGQIAASTATGAVSADHDSLIGGAIGGMGPGGTVTALSAIGAVTGLGANSMVGGLIGGSFGLVTLSNASGTVTGTSNSFLGGLLGANAGIIAQSYATGRVTGSGAGNFAGGLTGANFAWSSAGSSGTILQAFATGAVSSGASSYVGGLVGANLAFEPAVTTASVALSSSLAPSFSPSITQSYATGAVTGGTNSYVGGLVALNSGTIDQTYAVGLVTAGTGSVSGGLVALNSLNLPPSPLPAYPSPLQTCNECAGFVQASPVAGGGTVTNSYWDNQSTAQTSSAAGSAQTTAQLTSGLPVGFDPTTWLVNAGTTYPYLGAPQPVSPPVPQSGGDPPTTTITPQAQFVQQLVNNVISISLTTGDVINAQSLFEQQQQQQQQPQQQQQQRGSGPPGQLDVGPGRFFFIPPPGEARFVSDQVLLQIDSSIPLDELQRIAGQLGLTIMASQDIGLLGKTSYQFRINNGGAVADIIRQLAAFQIITGATPNYSYSLTQDAADQEGDAGQYVLEKLKLIKLHRAARGSNVAIAVIDSQIDTAHPDLDGVITSSYDATGVDEKAHPHGTGMAGAIAAHRRLVGVAPSAHLLAIHAFSTKSASPESTTFNILKGLDYAAANGVRIINMSFAGPRDPSLERAIKAASDKGVIMIAAAGNAGPKSPPLYPAADPNVIAVTATDMDDKLFSGANRGRYIAIAAPGVDILVPAPEGAYQLTTGTSVATAHISGIVALMLERNPKLSPADIRRILTASAKHLGPIDQFGAGLVDPAKAVELAAPRSAALTTLRQ